MALPRTVEEKLDALPSSSGTATGCLVAAPFGMVFVALAVGFLYPFNKDAASTVVTVLVMAGLIAAIASAAIGLAKAIAGRCLGLAALAAAGLVLSVVTMALVVAASNQIRDLYHVSEELIPAEGEPAPEQDPATQTSENVP
jgi:hypothetical protein